ncbi:hypothetical protein V6N13_033340 [Hibiscus sabdariffa]|uniref:Uncharacterized protein n=1 Tax=Hibiscus sabdariffa TaxID=183260 RepID=A0ABR2FAU1_9ROSI
MVWSDVLENLSWSVGNGHNVDFWHDNWIPNVGPLSAQVVTTFNIALPRVFVDSMLDANGLWSWAAFQHLLPVLLRIVATKELNSMFPTDAVGWGSCADQRFSVKSAYDFRLVL